MNSKSNLKYKYLARCALWDWHDNSTIDIKDYKNRVTAHLDEWQTLVFFEADGNTTADQLISSLMSKYQGIISSDVSEQILISTEELVEKFKVVELWNQKEDLPFYFELPRKEQEAEAEQEVIGKMRGTPDLISA